MNNIVKPVACKIREVRRESLHEYTFRVETDIRPSHGQFLQLSIPKVGEAPISVSSFGDGWMDFTIRSVGKVTDEIFEKQPGDILFLRGAYGKGWPVEQFQGKHMVVITGGTGLAPVKSMLNMFWEQEDFVKSVHLISGFKNEDGIIFKHDLDRWKEKFTTIYALDTDRKDGWETGFVTEFVSRIPFKDFGEDYSVVVVGPPPMMKFTGRKKRYGCPLSARCHVPWENADTAALMRCMSVWTGLCSIIPRPSIWLIKRGVAKE